MGHRQVERINKIPGRPKALENKGRPWEVWALRIVESQAEVIAIVSLGYWVVMW